MRSPARLLLIGLALPLALLGQPGSVTATNSALTVNTSTGAVVAPVNTATFRSANGIAPNINATLTTPTLVFPTTDTITGNAVTGLLLRGSAAGPSVVFSSSTTGGVRFNLPGTGGQSEAFDVIATLSTPITDNTYGARTFVDIQNGVTGHANAMGGHLAQLRITSDNTRNYTGRVHGGYSYLKHMGSGTLTDGRAHYIVTQIDGPGNITDASGLYIEGYHVSGTAGRMTSYRAIDIRPFNSSGSLAAPPSNLIGVHVRDLTGAGATTTRGVFVEGNTESEFQGAVTVGSLATGGVIRSTGSSNATALDTGMLRILGGGSVSRNLWVGERLTFPATATGNTIGLSFGTELYLYRAAANTWRFDGGNGLFAGDWLPTTTATFDLGSSSQRWRQLFVSGAATVGSLSTAGSVLLSGNGNPLGYTTGAGGTVTQLTSKSTGVTLNRATGRITMHNAALAAGAIVSFTFTNNTIAATDVPLVAIASGASADSYEVAVTAVAAGSCRIQVRNISTGSLSEALVLNFALIKGASS